MVMSMIVFITTPVFSQDTTTYSKYENVFKKNKVKSIKLYESSGKGTPEQIYQFYADGKLESFFGETSIKMKQEIVNFNNNRRVFAHYELDYKGDTSDYYQYFYNNNGKVATEYYTYYPFKINRSRRFKNFTYGDNWMRRADFYITSKGDTVKKLILVYSVVKAEKKTTYYCEAYHFYDSVNGVQKAVVGRKDSTVFDENNEKIFGVGSYKPIYEQDPYVGYENYFLKVVKLYERRKKYKNVKIEYYK